VRAIEDGEEHRVDDVLDEDRWRLYAQTSAAKGVRSSLSMPMRCDGAIVGSVNLYAASAAAFLGEEQQLARVFQADVEEAVNNADLSMSTLHAAPARATAAGGPGGLGPSGGGSGGPARHQRRRSAAAPEQLRLSRGNQ
jgi:GAF domain-containing protein